MKKKLFIGMLMAALCVNPLYVSAKDVSVGEDFTGTKSFVYEGYAIDKDYEGNRCIVLLFNYTNQNAEASMASNDYFIQAFQNGISLDGTVLGDESQYSEMDDNGSCMIKNGISLEVAFSYVLQDDSLVDFSIEEEEHKSMLAENLTIDISSETGDFVRQEECDNEDVTEQLEEKDKEIEELNKQLEEKDKEISRLQSELDETKKTTENDEEDKSVDDVENNNENEDTEKAALVAVEAVRNSLKSKKSFELYSISEKDIKNGGDSYYLFKIDFSAQNTYGADIDATFYKAVSKDDCTVVQGGFTLAAALGGIEEIKKEFEELYDKSYSSEIEIDANKIMENLN